MCVFTGEGLCLDTCYIFFSFIAINVVLGKNDCKKINRPLVKWFEMWGQGKCLVALKSGVSF